MIVTLIVIAILTDVIVIVATALIRVANNQSPNNFELYYKKQAIRMVNLLLTFYNTVLNAYNNTAYRPKVSESQRKF